MQKIIVTGGLGFIGTNIVRKLNATGVRDVTIVDEYRSDKTSNLLNVSISDFIPRDKFNPADHITSNPNDELVVFHMGAKSSTRSSIEDVLRCNVESTNKLLDLAGRTGRCRIVYASSASVYGTADSTFSECEISRPTSPYSWSKATIDNRTFIPGAGLRFFNVYGPHESHKDKQSSCIRQFWHSLASKGNACVFGPGPVLRDFIHVDDVVDTCLYFALGQGRGISGVYNVGTGTATSFNTVAELVAKSFTGLTGRSCEVVAGTSPITSSPNYQRFTKANTARLQRVGVNCTLFKTIDAGVTDYCQWLHTNESKSLIDLTQRSTYDAR